MRSLLLLYVFPIMRLLLGCARMKRQVHALRCLTEPEGVFIHRKKVRSTSPIQHEHNKWPRNPRTITVSTACVRLLDKKKTTSAKTNYSTNTFVGLRTSSTFTVCSAFSVYSLAGSIQPNDKLEQPNYKRRLLLVLLFPKRGTAPIICRSCERPYGHSLNPAFESLWTKCRERKHHIHM